MHDIDKHAYAEVDKESERNVRYSGMMKASVSLTRCTLKA